MRGEGRGTREQPSHRSTYPQLERTQSTKEKVYVISHRPSSLAPRPSPLGAADRACLQRRPRHELLHSVSEGARIRGAHGVCRHRRRRCRRAGVHRGARARAWCGQSRHGRRRAGDLVGFRQAVHLGGRGLPGAVSAARFGPLPDRRCRDRARERNRHARDRARLHRHGQRPGPVRSRGQGARRLRDRCADPRSQKEHRGARLRAALSEALGFDVRAKKKACDQREPARADDVGRRDRPLGSTRRRRARLVRNAGLAGAASRRR